MNEYEEWPECPWADAREMFMKGHRPTSVPTLMKGLAHAGPEPVLLIQG